MNFHWIYIPCSDKKEALNIARKLVEEKLIACGNVFDNVTSIYSWKGEMAESAESILVCKTREEHYEKVRARVEELHSYDCPCIIALPIEKGNGAYLKWISDQTN